jgi:uroporphyrinogen decarboxylase
MRQAGRYLPEYRALRERYDFLTLMRTPELAARVTLQPIRRFAFDAAILFADIMTPIDGLGLGLSFGPGPALERPVRSAAAVDALPPFDAERSCGHVLAAIRAVRAELSAAIPLIGFAGAPFTVFCYLVEGGASTRFPRALAFLDEEPEAARRLLDKLAEITIAYLRAQASAGAQALMLFDTLSGLLPRDRFATSAMAPARRVLEALGGLDCPRIYFPRANNRLADAAVLPAEVLGVESSWPLSRARAKVGPNVALQGNLDPAALLGTDEELDRQVDEVLREAAGAPGHIFNLGHGIDPATDPEKVARLIERVHQGRSLQLPSS